MKEQFPRPDRLIVHKSMLLTQKEAENLAKMAKNEKISENFIMRVALMKILENYHDSKEKMVYRVPKK